jgi:hypothetical protein
MEKSDSKAFRATAIFMLGAGLLQIFGLIRHVERLPGDWVGIGIYFVCIVAFVIAAFGFYSRTKQG